MRLRWREFEKRLGREVKARVRRRSGGRPFRRPRSAPSGPPDLLCVLYPVGVALCLEWAWWLSGHEELTTEVRAAVLALCALGVVKSAWRRAGYSIQKAPETMWLAFQPVLPRTVAEAGMDVFRRRVLAWMPLWLMAGSLVAIGTGGTGWRVAGWMLVGALHGAVAGALGFHALAWRPLARVVNVCRVGFVAALLLLLMAGEGTVSPETLRGLGWVPVFGWLNQAWLRGIDGEDPAAWGLLVPVALVFATLPWAKRRILRQFRLVEAGAEKVGEPCTAGRPARPEDVAAGEELEAVRESIRSGAFLAEASWWREGWLERLAGGWLDARGRVTAEWLLGEAPGWTASFRQVLKRWAVAMAVVLVLGWALEGMRSAEGLPLLLLPLLVPVMAPQPRWPGWGARAQRMGAGSMVPVGWLPLDAREVHRVQVRLIRLLMWPLAPVVAGTAVVVAWWCPEVSGAKVADYTLRLLAGVFLAAPLLAEGEFSQGTGFVARYHSALMLLRAVAVIVGATSVFAPHWLAALVGMGFFAGLQAVLVSVRNEAWAAGWFDMGGGLPHPEDQPAAAAPPWPFTGWLPNPPPPAKVPWTRLLGIPSP